MRIVIIILIPLIILTACNTDSATPTATREAFGVTVVAENTPMATEALSSPNAATPVAIIEDCPGAPVIRLIIQERGRVMNDDERTLNLREGPGTSFKVVVAIDPNELFFVLDGPECDGEYAWFRVQYRSQVGWIAEGDKDAYYVEPYLPG